MTTPTIDSVNADLQTLKTQVPSLEDMTPLSVRIECLDSAGSATTRTTGSYATTVLVAPYPLKVLSMAISFDNWSLTSSDTAYWDCQIKRWSAGVGTLLAERTTQSTGALANGGITPRVAWTFDSAPWVDTTFAAGELLLVRWAPTGSPALQQLPSTYTFRVWPV